MFNITVYFVDFFSANNNLDMLNAADITRGYATVVLREYGGGHILVTYVTATTFPTHRSTRTIMIVVELH